MTQPDITTGSKTSHDAFIQNTFYDAIAMVSRQHDSETEDNSFGALTKSVYNKLSWHGGNGGKN